MLQLEAASTARQEPSLMDMTNRKPRSISTTVCLTRPPSKQRAAPWVRLDSPDAWAAPGVPLEKFVTSQLRFRASALSSGIAPPFSGLGFVLRPLADVCPSGD